MKTLNQVITAFEKVDAQWLNAHNQSNYEDFRDALCYLREYREQKYMWDAILEFYKDIKELMEKWHEKFG